MKLLLGDLTLTGEGKRFSLTALSFQMEFRTACDARDKRLFPILICVVAKVLCHAHNMDKAGREGVGYAE